MPLYPMLFAVVGVLLIALAVPLLCRRVKPNRLYGLRVHATFADDWVWYEANARSGRDLAILGAIQLAIAASRGMLPISDTHFALINAAFLGIGSMVFCVVGWRRANSLLEERHRSP